MKEEKRRGEKKGEEKIHVRGLKGKSQERLKREPRERLKRKPWAKEKIITPIPYWFDEREK